MNSIEVCLSPELFGKYDPKDKTVVAVDILRATSCMTAGIASGISEIYPFEDVEECRGMKDKGYIIAGERGGQKIEGFALQSVWHGDAPAAALHLSSRLQDLQLAGG